VYTIFMMKNETTLTKLTAAQAYALQVKADRRAAAIERRGNVVREDNARVNAMFIVAEKVATPKVAKVKKATKKVRWTGAELDLLIVLYLKHVDAANGAENATVIYDEFSKVFDTRTQASLCLAIAQIKGLDVYYPAKGMKDTSQELIDKLHAVDPVRFPGGASSEEKVMNALDLLLAELR
jgi:hypothetical protein